MSMVVMGSSFKTASIEARERISLSAAEVPTALRAITQREGIDEAVIISTCNRVEVYVCSKNDRLGMDALSAFFSERGGSQYDPTEFYLHRGMDMVEHLFRVVCSLDSQLLGEAQILGQTKRAFELASDTGTTGEVLTKLFKCAITLGKRVRTETRIGSDSVSLSTTAFNVVQREFDTLQGRRALIIGTGEMARLAANYLVVVPGLEVWVTNHDSEHAREFAAEFGCIPKPYDDLATLAASCDAVFSMTSAPDVVIAREELERARAMFQAFDKKLVMVDEAIPRDIDPDCAEIANVLLYNLEDLGSIIDEGMSERMAAVGEAERMVSETMGEFLHWMQERLVTPTIRDIYEKAEATVASELEHARKSLARLHGGTLTEAEEQVLDAFGHAISKKILHGPTIRLRKEAQTPDSYYYTTAARYLFGLDTFPAGTRVQRRCCPEHFCEQDKPCPKGHPPLSDAERAQAGVGVSYAGGVSCSPDHQPAL